MMIHVRLLYSKYTFRLIKSWKFDLRPYLRQHILVISDDDDDDDGLSKFQLHTSKVLFFFEINERNISIYRYPVFYCFKS